VFEAVFEQLNSVGRVFESVDPVDGKVVVVTGGAGGLGLQTARQFGALGARVAIIDVAPDALETAGRSLDEAGVTNLLVPCDIRDEKACKAAIDTIVGTFGDIDVLVNNAGITHRSLLANTEAEVLRRVVEVNLFGAMFCTQAALPSLKRTRGRVVAVSSVAGFAPLMGRTAYAASKHAMQGFFSSLRTEVAGDGIGVLVVSPGFINTAMDRRASGGGDGELGTKRRSVGRQLRPEEAAEQIVDAVLRRRRTLLITPVAVASLALWRLFPRLYEKLMIRSQAPEFAV